MAAVGKALGRGAELYLLHALLTLGFIVASGLTGAFWFQPIEGKLDYLVGVLTLRQTYYITDVLQLYAVVVLVSPLALLLLARGRTVLLLLGSGLLWAIYQRYPSESAAITENVAFPAAAWQIYFFVGLAIGYHRARIEAFLDGIPMVAVAPPLAVAALAMLAQHLSGETLLLTDRWVGQSYADLFFKWDVHPGRLLAAAVFFPLAYLLVTVAWRPLRAGLGWFLLPLGQNSLFAYSAQLPVLLVAGTVLGRVGLEGPNPGVNSAIQMVGVSLVWAMVKTRSSAPAKQLLRPPRRAELLRTREVASWFRGDAARRPWWRVRMP